MTTRPLDPPISLQLRVLLAITDPDTMTRTLGEVSRHLGITERTAQAAVADLDAAGLISRSKDGRRNVYEFPTPAARRYAERARIAARMLSFDSITADETATAAETAATASAQ